MSIKKHIPNAITCLNLFSGILATIAAYNAEYDEVMLYVMISALLDFCDGFCARLLHVSSSIGKELDSLADVVSFGLVPGMVVFSLLQPLQEESVVLPYGAFLLTIFSALRLAKFNIDERQTSSFIGLATPANALFWVALAFEYGCEEWTNYSLGVLCLLVLLFSYLLVCELPMFSFKVKAWRLPDATQQVLFLVGFAILVSLFSVAGVCYSIVWYILISLVAHIRSKRKRA